MFRNDVFCCVAQLGKERFHKSQHFSLVEGLPKLVGLEKPGIGGEPLPGQKMRARSVYPRTEGTHVPSWLAFDKQVLTNLWSSERKHDRFKHVCLGVSA